MDATFTNIFSKQPDEIINGDYFYRTWNDGEYGQDVSWAKYKGIAVEELHLEREKLWSGHEIIYNNEKYILQGSFKIHWDMRTFESEVDPDNIPPWLINLYKSNGFSKINDILTKIAAEGKPFMDISSCEGMGLASLIIKKNPKIPCLVTDFHAHLLKNLRLFVNRELTEYNINIASFDNFDMPIKDNSFDYITSIYGILSSSSAIPCNELYIEYLTADKEKAINEVYRILKPEGCFITIERYVEWTFDLPKIHEECNLHGKLLGEFTYDEIIDLQQKLKSPAWRDKFLEAGFEIEIEKKFLINPQKKLHEVFYI